MRFHCQKSVHQLFLWHFQTEYGNCDILSECHILCNVQYKGCFPHGRTGCDQHQIRRMHTGCFIIQIHKACGNTCYRTFKLRRFLNVINGIQNYLLDWNIFFIVASLENIEQFFFRFFQNNLCILLLQIAGVGNLFICLDKSAKNCFLTDDLCVVLHICRSRNRWDQISYIFHTADIRREFFLL